LQSMMQEFYRLTHMGIGIIDIEGNVLVGVGWQDVCTKFFRAHPETCKCCLESDCTLSRGIPAGTYKAYHCKNHLWDLATPIEVDGQHLGNVFLGQFFYDDEVPDEDLFRRMAHQYGFDETAFLAAVASVPRWSRETVDATMTFYTKLAGMISTLSYHKVRLSQVLVEKSATLSELKESRKRLYAILSSIHSGILVVQEEGTLEFVNQAFCELYAISDDPDSLRGMSSADFIRKIEQGFADPVRAVTRIREILQRNELIIGEEVALRGGHIHLRDCVPIVINGKRCGRIWYARDITALKQAEAEAKRSEAALQRQLGLFKSLMENLPVGVFMVEAPSGKPLLANEAALRLLGRGVLPDASRTNLAEVYKASKLSTHEPYPLDELPILRGMNGTSSYVDDMLVERPDGTKTILEVFGSPVRNEQGQVWASLVSFNDISRRRQDEETIRRNEDRLRGLVNILQYRMSTIQEFLDMALNEVIRLTDSKIGYIYFYHEDRRQFVLNTWSKEVMQQCSVVNPQTTYDLDQ
ncbi:MAG TPA: PocR ligand-binding domain-containing protein, partial [Candidatus Ozemobacteraceae bacterium]|nr:PocR ligand-binding domain-containing protein [Candidatus Ozemobacteraceae bacterium]